MNDRRTIGLLFLDNWRGVNLSRNKNELSTLMHKITTNHCPICTFISFIKDIKLEDMIHLNISTFVFNPI